MLARCGGALLLAIAALAAAQPVRANDAEIISIIGRGDARESADAPWRAAAVKQKLFAGNFVRTAELSTMGLLLRDRTQVRLNQLSILNIKSVGTGDLQPTRLELPQGRAWSQARPKPAPEPAPQRTRLEVTMPSGVAGIRGTDWELVVDPDGTSTVTVLSGEIDFHNEHGRVLVAANEQARARPGQAPVKILLTRAADRVQWVTAYRPQPRRWVKDFSGPLEPVVRDIEAQSYAPALQALRGLRDVPGVAPRASLLLADLYLFLGQVADAVSLLAPHAAAEPMAAALLARAQIISGDLGAAGGTLETAAQRHPDHVEVLLARAELARLQGDAEGARRFARRALELEPQNAEAWYLIGRIETEREFARAAREALGRAIALQPEGPGYQGELATLETFANRFGAAQAAFNEALARQPDDYVALTGLGVLELKRGNTEAALESFLKAGTIEPRYARAWLFTGVAHYQLGDRVRALEAFARAGSLDDKDPLPHLVRSLVYYDALELGAAVEAARAAQARLPYLKSLNQVLSDQKGNANLGSALAAFGLEEWSQAYAYDSYSPYWAGSHLFLADRFSGTYNRNSELFKGFLSDPAVFGASNRWSSLVPVPGHYRSLEAEAARDYIEEWRLGAALNGYSVAALPLAYFVAVDKTEGDSAINRNDTDGRMRAEGENLVLGLGLRPMHELGVFAFANATNYSGRIAERLSGLTDDNFESDYRRYDAGLNYKFSPTNHAWLKIGYGTEEVPLSGVLVSQSAAEQLNRLSPLLNFQAAGRLDNFRFDLEQSDVQWRHTFDLGSAAQLTWGAEYAQEEKPLAMAMEFVSVTPLLGTLPLRITLDQRNRVQAAGVYLSGKFRPWPALEGQVDLHHQDMKSSFATSQSLRLGTFAPIALPPQSGETRHRELNPRFGVKWRPLPGNTVRAATQVWRRPPGVNTLAPLDTVGIALDDRIERAAGRLKRARLQHEVEWGRATFAEWFFDHKSIDNPQDPGAAIVPDLELEQLEKLRARRTAYTVKPEYLEDDPKFGAGRVNLAGAAVNRLLTRNLSLGARYAYARTYNTTSEFSGLAVPFHPRHTFNAGLTWQPYARWIVGPHATYRSHRFGNEANTERLDAGWGFGASAYWESDDKRWSLGAVATELHPDRQSSIYRHALYRLQAAFRF
jgi:Flp pilus assembly protein TadD